MDEQFKQHKQELIEQRNELRLQIEKNRKELSSVKLQLKQLRIPELKAQLAKLEQKPAQGKKTESGQKKATQ